VRPSQPAPAPAGKAKEIVPVAVDVPGLDKPMAKSSTVWAAIAGFGTTGLATAQGFLDSVTGIDWRVMLVLILLMAAVRPRLDHHGAAQIRRRAPAIKAGIEQIAPPAQAEAG
jgi:hypothetical protein